MNNQIEIGQTTKPTHAPEHLLCRWEKIFFTARRYLAENDWQDASETYALAMNIAETLLKFAPKEKEAQLRYVRTAIEFAYTTRMANTHTNLNALVAIVEFNLMAYMDYYDAEELTIPLKDIAYAPKEEISYWMTTLFAMEERLASTLH